MMAQDYTTDPYNSAHVVATDMGEINNNFAALKSAFSGPTTPANTVAGQWWYDTTAHILKVRNEANTAWLSVWDLANNKPVIANLSNEITLGMMAASAKSPAAGTEGLRKLGTGALDAMPGNAEVTPPDGSVTLAKLAKHTAGDNLAAANDGEKEHFSTAWIKIKEFYIPVGGTLRISFDLKCTTGSYPAYGQIYRNGTAVGSQQSTTSESYVTYTQDIGGWSSMDRVQLYMYGGTLNYPTYARNFRIYVAAPRDIVVTM